jgi:GntR family transcriptional repressor for pyruvate dehydrogenase complex
MDIGIMAATAKRNAYTMQDGARGGAGTLRRDNAVACIRKLIEKLKLKPGDRLPGERQLATKFNISRGTVREALQILAALNLVEIRHGGGCFLRAAAGQTQELSAGWAEWVTRHRGLVLETLEVRLGCETFAARLAARRAGPAELSKLVEALRTMKVAADARDVPAFVQSDLDFHAALLEASGNKTLNELVGALGRVLIPERAAILDISGRGPKSVAEHCAIYEAVRQGDPPAAALAMHRHLESVRRDIFVHLLGDANAATTQVSALDEPAALGGLPADAEQNT